MSVVLCYIAKPGEGAYGQIRHDLWHQELRHDEEGARLARTHGVDYVFHDYKTEGILRERLQQWCRKVGWEILLNRAGTTFRKLPESEKARVDARKATELMLEQPSMIKRPVLELGRRQASGWICAGELQRDVRHEVMTQSTD